jgi:predicted nucleic acid-binding Zn ribbon protein
MVHRRDPVLLGDVLGEFTREAQPATALAEVQRVWPDAVGEVIAKWGSPVSESGGVVTIECDDSMVAGELNMMKESILEKLREKLPERAVSELRFRVK